MAIGLAAATLGAAAPPTSALQEPATRTAALPDGNQVARGLVERTRKREAALDQYTYDLVSRREELDGEGQVRKVQSERREVTYVMGHPVKRLVEENGRRLSPRKQAEEDRRARFQADAIRSGEALFEDAAPRLSRLLERYEFRSLAREPWAGRELLVLGFEPRPGKRELENDQVWRALSGQLWVDEVAGELVRAELKNRSPIRYGLGLGAKVNELEIHLELARVDDLYLPRRIETRVSGRVLLFKNLRRRLVSEYGPYRRFSVTSTEAVAPPGPGPSEVPTPPPPSAPSPTPRSRL